MIKKLSDDKITAIQSEQYISSLNIIVKELIENSLDAKSQNIKIYIDDNEIKVEDDGDGITDINLVGKLGYTSKQDVTEFVIDNSKTYDNFSYGFRGQALYSLANIAEMEITTCVKGKKAEKKCFKSDKVSLCAREKGTTVKIKNVFYNSNIRQKCFISTLAKDRKKIMELIDSYCFMYAVSFYVFFKKKLLYKINGSGEILEELKNRFDFVSESNYSVFKSKDYTLYIGMDTSKNRDCQHIFIDKRPVNIKSIKKTIENTFNLFLIVIRVLCYY